jgi:RNA polymerase-binding transcription factor DksA
MSQVNCRACGTQIPPRRLTAVPGTKFCVKCVDTYDTKKIDVEALVAKSSTSARNGFAPQD